jgi:hypothetical protein
MTHQADRDNRLTGYGGLAHMFPRIPPYRLAKTIVSSENNRTGMATLHPPVRGPAASKNRSAVATRWNAEMGLNAIRMPGAGLSVRRLLAVLVAMAFAFLAKTPAEAWEISLSGDYTWTYETYSQMGSKGFFGKYDADRSTPAGDLASFNGWFGPALGLVSGSKASQAEMNLNLYPHIRINPAIGVTGRYRIASWNDVTGGSYLIGTAPGINVPISQGQWALWWFYARTPWGNIFYGKRPFNAGCGLQFDGSGNRTQEALVVTADYGPLRFGAGGFPWKDIAPYYPGVPAAWNIADDNRSVSQYLIGFLSLYYGPVELGSGTVYTSFGQGPESQITAAARNSFPRTDTQISEGWIYSKYNNGRIFCNAECDWYYRCDTHQLSADGTFNGTADNADGSGSLFAPKHLESWRYMVESGLLAGPAKLTLFYSFLPGPDRRHGVLIDRQPYVQRPEQGNTILFAPYSILLAGTYGAGTNAVDYNRGYYLSDASVLAAKVDYAVAANLNLSGSVLYADRVSHGYGWGFVSPTATGNVRYVRQGSFLAPVPAIPDLSLGWEAGAGVSWALLDNWNLYARGAYWQPGKWFNYACVDRSVAGWTGPTAANNWGVIPGRGIDPVVGAQMLVTTFF